MKDHHTLGKYHLSPKTGCKRERRQSTLGADLDIWLVTLGQHTLNTFQASQGISVLPLSMLPGGQAQT